MPREAVSERNQDPAGGSPPAGLPRRLRLIAWLALLPLAAAFVLCDGGLLEQRLLRGSLDSLARAEERLAGEIQRLKQLNSRLEAGDPFTVEAEARRLGMARPGEEVWRVILDEDTLGGEGRR
jgi:cell division protein FtsB